MLAEWDIPFTEKDITRDPAAVEELVRLGGAAPLTMIDGRPVSNLDAATLIALFAAEDDAAPAAPPSPGPRSAPWTSERHANESR